MNGSGYCYRLQAPQGFQITLSLHQKNPKLWLLSIAPPVVPLAVKGYADRRETVSGRDHQTHRIRA